MQGKIDLRSNVEANLSEKAQEAFGKICDGLYRLQDDVQARVEIVGGVQAALEAQLAKGLFNKTIVCCVGVVHTPTPCTPMRMDLNSDVVPGVEDIAQKPELLDSVKARTTTVRSILRAGGTLVSFYSDVDTSSNKDIQASLPVYQKLVETSNGNLIDRPIEEKFDGEMVGATYLIEDNKGERFIFSLRGCQAHEAGSREWRIGYTNVKDLRKNPELQAQYENTKNYLAKYDLNIEELFAQRLEKNKNADLLLAK